MTAKAILRNARVSPQKARLVADLVRGLDVDQAMEVLTFTRKKSAGMIKKLVESAVANAENNGEQSGDRIDVDNLYIKTIYVDGGPVLKRWRPRAMGRATRVLKRTSHITVELDER
jgi:large subunit ribosomal protein L22